MSIHRIIAIVAYVDGSIAHYTSADDGVVHQLSSADFDTVGAELFSWPSFRTFMTSIGIALGTPVDISHIADITWSVVMGDGTGRSNVAGFEAAGGFGSNSDSNYDPLVFDSFDTATEPLDAPAALATATMRPVSLPDNALTGGSGYVLSQEILVPGGVFTSQAVMRITGLSTIIGQDETDFGGGETAGTFTPGTGYGIGDTVTLSDPGSGTVVTVDDVGTAGDVLEFTVTTATPGVNDAIFDNFDTLTQDSTSGSGVGFSLTLKNDNQAGKFISPKELAEIPIGEYTTLPTNPVVLNGGGGTGLTVNTDWGVRSVAVVDGGSGYTAPPAVTFGGAGGVGTSGVAVLTDDVVTSVTVASPGSGYTARATVTIVEP